MNKNVKISTHIQFIFIILLLFLNVKKKNLTLFAFFFLADQSASDVFSNFYLDL